MRIVIIIFYILFFSVSQIHAQNKKTDSLIQLTKTCKTDSLRVKAFASLCYILRNSNQDTAMFYGNTGLQLAQQIKWDRGISLCNKNMGLAKFEIAQYEAAITFFMKALKIDEKNNDKRSMATTYNYIGGVYNEQNRYDKAEEYYQKSLDIRKTINDKKGLASSYNNMGLIFYNQGNYIKALEYYTNSLHIKEGSGDKFGLAGSYNNVGMAHAEMAHTELAIEFYQKSLQLREEIVDQKGIAAVLGNIAILNNTLADSAKTKIEKLKHFKESIKYGLKCMEISEQIDALLWKNKTAESLQKAYKGIGDIEKALEYAEIFISTNDSLFREDKVKAITEIDVKYQTEKKEQVIELQKTHIEKKEAETKQQKTLIYSILAGLFLLLLLFIIVIIAYKQKQKANILLTQQKHEIEEKNEELNQQKEEIISQRDEIEQQRNQIQERNNELNLMNIEISAQRDFVIKQGDILSRQNEILESQKQDITDSILYALRIQQVLLPKEELFSSAFKENFILFKPRDIVSGDFYWIQKINDSIIFCVADCTGHGVPGAFMSMLGISFLNEIIRNKEIVKASQILDELRNYVIDALHQEGNTYEQKDGMDISLCIFNTTSLELQYAGANNPCWIVKQFGNEPMTQFGNDKVKMMESVEQFPNLIELKPDKMPIGIYDRIVPFINKTIKLKQGDTIYLFTDGFTDQFGGEKETKFKTKSFRELLLSVTEQPLSMQREILNSTIETWRGYKNKNHKKAYEQTDDITVLGIKI